MPAESEKRELTRDGAFEAEGGRIAGRAKFGGGQERSSTGLDTISESSSNASKSPACIPKCSSPPVSAVTTEVLFTPTGGVTLFVNNQEMYVSRLFRVMRPKICQNNRMDPLVSMRKLFIDFRCLR